MNLLSRENVQTSTSSFVPHVRLQARLTGALGAHLNGEHVL